MADVVSQIAWWTDMDVGADGNWSLRESALDYTLQFSADGINWRAGTVRKVFIEGWTTNSDAENWIARWESPVDAKFVRISELIVNGHDGNAQIDAIIVPEPTALAILAMGAAALVRKRR